MKYVTVLTVRQDGFQRPVCWSNITTILDWDRGDLEAVEGALRGNPRGLVVVPGLPGALKPVIQRASRSKIPVVCVNTDALGRGRPTAVTMDPSQQVHCSGVDLPRTIASLIIFIPFRPDAQRGAGC